MAIQVQLRRGTATENNAFTGAIGELSFDTTNNQIRVHDGSTAGGFKIGVGDFPTGTNNVVLGNTALDSLDGSSPGGNNTAVGHDALTANTTASNNVAVGKDALKANTTGASNTALGEGAGSLISTGSKNLVLGGFDGNQGGLDIRTSSNYIVLSDGDGNPRLTIDNNGNLDIGDTTTELKLKNTTHEDTDGGRESKITFQGEQSGGEQSVLAQIQASHDGSSDDEKGDLIFRTNDGSDGSSPTEAMRLTSGQRLGLGENDPDANFHIDATSSGSFTEAMRISNTGGGADEGSYIQWEVANTSGYGAQIGGRREGTGGVGLHFFTGEINGSPNEKMRIDHDGIIRTRSFAFEHQKSGNLFYQTRAGVRQGTGTYTLFTLGSSSTQSAGLVHVHSIIGTPNDARYDLYVISGDKSIDLALTGGHTGAAPSLAYSGNDLQVSNTNASIYYSVQVELFNIGNIWNATFGDFPDFV